MTNIHFIAMSSAGAEIYSAPIFPTKEALEDWLYAYAAQAFLREHRYDFAKGYEVDEASRSDKWRAAVEWAVETGRGDWTFGTREFGSVSPDGGALMPQAEVISLDEDYLATLVPVGAPAP